MIRTLYTEEVSIEELDDLIERGICFELISKTSLLAKDRCDTGKGTRRNNRDKSTDSVRDTDSDEDYYED